jgi:FK506-binding protein 2
MGIDGVKAPESIIEKTVSSVTSEATEGVKDAIKSKLADAAEAAKIVIADTDGDGQEHNEL